MTNNMDPDAIRAAMAPILEPILETLAAFKIDLERLTKSLRALEARGVTDLAPPPQNAPVASPAPPSGRTGEAALDRMFADQMRSGKALREMAKIPGVNPDSRDRVGGFPRNPITEVGAQKI